MKVTDHKEANTQQRPDSTGFDALGVGWRPNGEAGPNTSVGHQEKSTIPAPAMRAARGIITMTFLCTISQITFIPTFLITTLVLYWCHQQWNEYYMLLIFAVNLCAIFAFIRLWRRKRANYFDNVTETLARVLQAIGQDHK
jgi:hypothetical protein